MKTALEWFFNEIDKTYWDYMTFEQQQHLFKQAKEMEEKQIKDAWLSAWKDSMLNPLSDECCQELADEYYKQKHEDENTY